jgi:hypothetical protein
MQKFQTAIPDIMVTGGNEHRIMWRVFIAIHNCIPHLHKASPEAALLCISFCFSILLARNNQRAVCIGVNATDVRATTGTTGAITPTGIATPTRTSAGPTSSKPVAPPAQTLPSVPARCRAYYVAMRGDGGWANTESHLTSSTPGIRLVSLQSVSGRLCDNS